MKKTVLFLILGTLSFYATAQTPKESFQLSTHILDVQKGSPASGVVIVLYKQNSSDDSWQTATRPTGATEFAGRPPIQPGSEALKTDGPPQFLHFALGQLPGAFGSAVQSLIDYGRVGHQRRITVANRRQHPVHFVKKLFLGQ